MDAESLVGDYLGVQCLMAGGEMTWSHVFGGEIGKFAGIILLVAVAGSRRPCVC